MATTRPEASETTGTLRETSGVTAPVTMSSETVGWAVASTRGNCPGCSTANRFRSTSGTTLAGGGASAAASTCPLQPLSTSGKNVEARRRPRLLFFIRTPFRHANTRPVLETPYNASCVLADRKTRGDTSRTTSNLIDSPLLPGSYGSRSKAGPLGPNILLMLKRDALSQDSLTWLLYGDLRKQVIRIAMKLIDRVHKRFG